MFLTVAKRMLYRTNWSLYRMVVNIDNQTNMSWTNNILWLTKDGQTEIPIYFDGKDNLEKEVHNIVQTFNENEIKESVNRMIHHLETSDVERKLKN